MTWFRDLPGPLRGIAWMLLQAVSMAAIIAAVRKLTSAMGPFEIIFFRGLIGLIIQVPWLMRTGRKAFPPSSHGLVALRSLFVVIGMGFWFTALGAMPITDAVALQFTLPLFAILGAGLILREAVGLRRWTAAAIGFCGALVIIRPGFTDVNPMVFAVLATAVMVAGVQLCTKTLAMRVSGAQLVLHMNLVMAPVALAAAAPDWVWPRLADIPWLLVVGVLGSIAHLFMARAMRAADASLVAPMDFMRLPFAAIFGWLLFRESSDLWTWAGAAIIFASTSFSVRHEARAARLPAGSP